MKHYKLKPQDFGEWATLHQSVGDRAELTEINYQALHRTSISQSGLRKKQILIRALEGNIRKLKYWYEQEPRSEAERKTANSIWRSTREALNTARKQEETISYYLAQLNPLLEAVSEDSKNDT